MKTSDIALNPNKLVQYLGKEASEFRKNDIIQFIKENDIRMVNFMYPAADNRLKTLNFVINSESYLDSILTFGERVDGSSLFPFIEAGNSDLYVVPRLKTAFVDPFSEIPTLSMLCSFFTNNGTPLEISPEQTLRRAIKEFRKETGMDFHAMGELEYYVVADDPGSFQASDQKGYHESSPFAKNNEFRTECMALIASAGGKIKYGHSEVGNFTLNGKIYEQNEIEFLPVDPVEAAETLMLAKWIIRTLAYKKGLNVTFAPKITAGKAGSGLHIHFKLEKDGRNAMLESGKLSDCAKKAIAGILSYADAITAFGNKVPTSYLRLVPHQEAPTSVCWGDRNRSVLIRVPLGWNNGSGMFTQANPLEEQPEETPERQTVELRSADCSADIYQLLAGMITAARLGFENPQSLELAGELYVNVNIHGDSEYAKKEGARLNSLPWSCAMSADALESKRNAFEAKGVFAPDMIDDIVKTLRKYNDSDMRDVISGSKAAVEKLVAEFWHCG